jgi:broad specificity phosphatase PhoE
MTELILVRHAAPTINPATPSADWALAPEGHKAAANLGRALAPFAPGILVSGAEAKTIGTAAAIGGQLGLANQPLAGLEEHARRSAAFGDRAAFEASIQALFARPTEVVYGEESADATFARFAAAIEGVLASAGGTAISIFMARRLGIDPFSFWKALRLPQAFFLFTAPWRLEKTLWARPLRPPGPA